MGTPEFAVPMLEVLHHSEHQIVAVITAPDKPAGRGMNVQQSEVKQYAVANNLPVLQPEKLKNEVFLNELKSLQADLFLVVAVRSGEYEIRNCSQVTALIHIWLVHLLPRTELPNEATIYSFGLGSVRFLEYRTSASRRKLKR